MNKKPEYEKIMKRLDKELKGWKEHCQWCGYKDCIQQLETLQYIRYGRVALSRRSRF